jgi:hypothetical protein
MKFVFNPLTGTFETKNCGGEGGSGPTLIFGTEDGTPTGLAHVFVNNVFKQILASEDRVDTITYADAGTKNQRIIRIDYTSNIVHNGVTARKDITYTLAGNSYVVNTITKTLV